MTKEELIRENKELKSHLALAIKWMRREIQGAISLVRSKNAKKNQKSKFRQLLDDEGLDIMTRKVMDTYAGIFEIAPKYTLERLIDAEIYWSTLQKYPTMDGLPVILAYQKILDSWIEEKFIHDWRKQKRQDFPPVISSEDHLERDLLLILTKEYSLSIGRFYQIIKNYREKRILPSQLQFEITNFWNQHVKETFYICKEDHCFFLFEEIINLEVFARKRHESKVTYSDVRRTREIMEQLLQNIFIQ